MQLLVIGSRGHSELVGFVLFRRVRWCGTVCWSRLIGPSRAALRR